MLYRNEPCLVWMSRVTYACVMSHMNESCHIWIRQVTYEWVISHVNVSCPVCQSGKVHVFFFWLLTFGLYFFSLLTCYSGLFTFGCSCCCKKKIDLSCMYSSLRVCVYVVCLWPHACVFFMYACMYVCMYVWIQVRMYVCMDGWMDVCMYVCVCVFKYVCMNVCTWSVFDLVKVAPARPMFGSYWCCRNRRLFNFQSRRTLTIQIIIFSSTKEAQSIVVCCSGV